MNIYLQILMFLVLGFATMKLTIFLKTQINLSSALTRKIFHFFIFTAAGFILFYLGNIAVFLFGIVITFLILTAVLRNHPSSLYKALVRSSDNYKGKFSVLVPLTATALGGTISLLLFREYALFGFFVTGWGDGLAEPVGTRWGKHRFRKLGKSKVNSYKSLEGSLAFFIAGIIAAYSALCLMEISCPNVFFAVLIIVSASTLIEAFSPAGTDNFTVQLSASGLAYLLFHSNI